VLIVKIEKEKGIGKVEATPAMKEEINEHDVSGDELRYGDSGDEKVRLCDVAVRSDAQDPTFARNPATAGNQALAGNPGIAGEHSLIQ